MRSLVGGALVSVLLSSIGSALQAQDRSASAPIVYETVVASAPPPLSDTWLLPGRSKSIPAGRKVFATWLFLAVVSTIAFLILKCMRSLQSGSSKRVGLKERFLATGGTGPCHPSGADGGGDAPTTSGDTLLQALQLTGADLACLNEEEAAFVIQARRELEALLQEIREIEKILDEAAKLASGLETAMQAGDPVVMANLALAQQMVQQKKEEAEKVKGKHQELKSRLQSFGPTPEQRRRACVVGVTAFLGGRTLTPKALAAMALSETVLTGGLLGSASLTEDQTQRLQAQTAIALGSTITTSRRLGTLPSPSDADVIQAKELLEKLTLLSFVLGGMEIESSRKEARDAVLKLQASLEVARISLFNEGRNIDAIRPRGQSSPFSPTQGLPGPVLPLSGPGHPVYQYGTLQRPPRRSPTHLGPRPTYYTLPRGFSPKAYALKMSATPGSVPSHPPFPSDPGPRPPGQLAHPGLGGPRPLVLPPVDPQQQAGPGPRPRSAPPRGFDQRLSFPPFHPRPPSIRHPVRLQMPAPSTFQPPPQLPVSPSGLPSPRLPAAGPQRLPAVGPRPAFQLFSSSSAPAPAPSPRPPAVSPLPLPRQVEPPRARRPLSLPPLPSIDEEPLEDAGPLPPPLPPPEDASGHGNAGEEPSNSDVDYQPQPPSGDSGGNSPGPAGAEGPHTSSGEDTDEDSAGTEEEGDEDQPDGPADGPGDEPPDPYGGGGQPPPPPEDHPGNQPHPLPEDSGENSLGPAGAEDPHTSSEGDSDEDSEDMEEEGDEDQPDGPADGPGDEPPDPYGGGGQPPPAPEDHPGDLPQPPPEDSGGNSPGPAGAEDPHTSSEGDSDEDSEDTEEEGDANQPGGPPDGPGDEPPDPYGGGGQPPPTPEEHPGNQPHPLPEDSSGNSPGPTGAEGPHTSSEGDSDEDSEDTEEEGDEDQPDGPADGPGDEPPDPYGGGGQPPPAPEDHPGDQPQPPPEDSGGNSPGPAGAEGPHTSSEGDSDEDSEDKEEEGDEDQPDGPADGPGDEPPDPYGGGGQPHPPPEGHPGDPSNPDGGGQQQPPPPEDPGGGSQHPHDGVGLHASAERSDGERQHSDGGNQHQPPPNNPGGGAEGGGQQQGPPSDPNTDSPPAPPPADPAVLPAQLAGSGDGLDDLPPPPPPGDGGPPPPSDGAPALQEDTQATERTHERADALVEWAVAADILLLAAKEDPNNTAEAEQHFLIGAELLQKEKQTPVEGSASPQSIQDLKNAIAQCKSYLEEFQKVMKDTWIERLGGMRRRLTGCSEKLTRELASMSYPLNPFSCTAVLRLMKRLSATVGEARALLTQIETLSSVDFPASTVTFFLRGLYGSAEGAAALVSLAAAQLAEELTEHLQAQGTSSDGSGDASAGLPGLVVGEAQAASPSDESGGALAALPGVPELEDWSSASQALLQQARDFLKQLRELAGDTDEVLALEAQISLLEGQLGPS